MKLLVPTDLGICMLVGSMQLSSTRWGFQYLPNSSRDMVQNIFYNLKGGTNSL